jgi:hypothetical protein
MSSRQVDVTREGLDITERPSLLVGGVRPFDRLLRVRDSVQDDLAETTHDFCSLTVKRFDVGVDRKELGHPDQRGTPLVQRGTAVIIAGGLANSGVASAT